MKFLLAAALMFASLCGYGQDFDVSLDVTNASCSANGSLRVDLPSGTFSLQLSNDCGDVFPPQQSGAFTTLRPCDYELVVRRVPSGESIRRRFSVGGAGSTIEFDTGFNTCDAVIRMRGGLAPFQIEYEIDEVGFAPVATRDSFDFGELGDGYLEGRVTDACGNSRDFAIRGRETRPTLLDQYAGSAPDSVYFRVLQGQGPFNFTVNSDAGTFTSSDGAFHVNQLDCIVRMTVTGACPNSPIVTNVSVRPLMRVGCLNFREGTIDINVRRSGIQPYTFTIRYGDTIVTTSDTSFVGLPPGTRLVTVSGEDACGNSMGLPETFSPLRITTPFDAETCTDTDFSIVPDRLCVGGLFYPFHYEITSPLDQISIDSSYSIGEVVRGQASIGSYEIRMSDNCGDFVDCKDSLFLELIPACDSIIANLVHEFACDNESRSRRAVLDPSLRYSLYDERGTLLEADSETGRFTNLPLGTYAVEMAGDCGTMRKSVTLTAGVEIDPLISVRPIYSAVNNEGVCRFYYYVEISKFEGPYELTSLSNPDTAIVLNDFGVDVCFAYELRGGLPPGDYRLVSLSRCGEALFTLPDLNLEFIEDVTILETCPQQGIVEVQGTRWTSDDWERYVESGGGVNLDWFGRVRSTDIYLIDSTYLRDSVSYGLEDRTNIASIYPAFADGLCAIDSVEFEIPEYTPLGLDVDGEYLCNASGSTTLSLQPTGGNGPYELYRIDCSDPLNRLRTYGRDIDTIIDIDVEELGVYCFVIRDQCGITADFQVEVRNLEDALLYAYNCDETLTVSADTIAGSYEWFDAAGTSLGTGFSITVPAIATDQTFELRVTTEVCDLSATVTVPTRPITPLLTVGSSPFIQCDEDTVLLSALTDTFSLISWYRAMAGDTLRVDSTDTISVIEAGNYQITATNDLGCRTTGRAEVRRSRRPTPRIATVEPLCAGVPARLSVTADPEFTIEWGGNLGASDEVSVAANTTYTVEITNPDGCIGTDSFNLMMPPPLEATVFSDSLTCFDSGDGALIIEAAGGTGRLTYGIDTAGYSVRDSITGLPAGAYNVQVADANGCLLNVPTSVSQPDSGYMIPLSVDFVYDCTPSVVLEAASVPGAEYVWSSATARLSGVTNPLTVPPAGEDLVYTVMADDGVCQWAGAVTVAARDILPVLSLKATSLAVCAGDSARLGAAVDGLSDLNWSLADVPLRTQVRPWVSRAGDYVATATNDLGCVVRDTAKLIVNALPTPQIEVTPDYCPNEPITLNVATPSGESVYWWPTTDTTRSTLAATEEWYTVTTTDAIGCQGTDSLLIALPEPFRLDLFADSVSCAGAEDATLSVAGAGGSGALRYALAGDTLAVGQPTPGLAGGQYTVSLVDDHGCTRQERISIWEPDTFQLDLGEDRLVVFGETTSLSLVSNRSAVQLVDYPPGVDSLDLLFGLVSYKPDRTGAFMVSALDERGCLAETSVLLTVDRDLRLYAPTAFSPNSDGQNDAFTLMGDREQVDLIERLRVFDRWGSLLFESEAAEVNDLTRAWRGLSPNGRALKSGVYVWSAAVRYFDGTVKEVSGSVTLVR